MSEEKTVDKLNQSNSLSFLLAEYGECFNHMRHYDSMNLSIATFTFTFYSIIATISFGIWEYFKDSNIVHLPLFLGLFLLFNSLSGFLIILTLARNRLYFVKVARQVNSLRKKFVSISSIDYENLLYTDPKVPVASNKSSSQVILLNFIAFVNSAFLATSIYFFIFYLFNISTKYLILLSSIAYILGIIIGLKIISWKLSEKERGYS